MHCLQTKENFASRVSCMIEGLAGTCQHKLPCNPPPPCGPASLSQSHGKHLCHA